jgi:hypothetical protein
MKLLLCLFFSLTVWQLQAQNLPTPPENGFAFPLGSKFTIKLLPYDSTHFYYSVTAFEPFNEIIDTYENDSLFQEEGEAGTISFYFCISTHGDTEAEREENNKVVLLMKNRTEYHLRYDSEIQREEDGPFEKTSNVGTFRGAKGAEIWPYFIYQIGLFNFRLIE